MFVNGVTNTLQEQLAKSGLCKLLGVRLITNPSIVYLAKNAGYDALFIELEHSSLTIEDVTRLCMTSLPNGITPFVRVPYQCGYGVVQQALDSGAMGIIFPHIHNKRDAEAAVKICKYPPQGCRSMTGQLPLYGLKQTAIATVVEETNKSGSSVILMIETTDSIDRVDEIAAVEGVEGLLIGSNDLSIELGVPGDFQSEKFRAALTSVSEACKSQGKVMGLAGIYEHPELQSWAIEELGVRFMLVQQDSGILAGGGKRSADAVNRLMK